MLESFKAAFKEIFPDGTMTTRTGILGDNNTVYVTITMRSQYAYGYAENDPMHTRFKLDLTANTVELVSGSRLYVKPAPDSHYAKDSIKIPFRKINGKSEFDTLTKFTNWMLTAKDVADTNADRIFPLDG